jgi:hypothetical protein
MTDLKPLSHLGRAAKLLSDYHLAKSGYDLHVNHERAARVPSGMCRHIWAKHIDEKEIRERENAAWQERLASLKAKIVETGYDPDA